MTTIFQIIIITSLTFVAIMIALFVFASSIYKGAIKIAADEEQEALNNRREFLEKRRKEIVKELKEAGGDEFAAKLKESLTDLGVKTKQINQSISKSRDKVKRLNLKSMVVVPGFFLVLSLTGAGIAAMLSGGWQASAWGASVVALIAGVVFIYRNLQAIEKFSSIIDVSVLMEQALDAHAKKTNPKLFLDFWGENLKYKGILKVGRGKTAEIAYVISLIQGTIGKKARVMFTATEELEFIDSVTIGKKGRVMFTATEEPENIDSVTIEEASVDYYGMTNPKRINMQYGDINPKEYEGTSIYMKAPEETGEYIMSYFLQCEGFTEDEKFFKIVVE